MEQKIHIVGLRCGACVDQVTAALEKAPGVTSAHVELDPPLATLQCAEEFDQESLAEALRSAGDYSISTTSTTSTRAASPHEQTTYFPLLLIVALLILTTGLLQFRSDSFRPGEWMSDFMGGFFVVFAFFKLLDVRGFAAAFKRYDLVAKKSHAYALAYPFLELALGVAYLSRWRPFLTNLLTLAFMVVGSLGVIQKLRRGQGGQIPCACLGTAFQLPMSTVTLIEDVGMALMAAAMLFLYN